MEKKNLVILTGAGISAESGVPTFRDSGGLWEGHRVHDVASPMGWAQNPQLVLDFYNGRRKALDSVEPNDAHRLIVELEEFYNVFVITQNVDDLHERAGTKNNRMVHLHGELRKMRSVKDDETLYNYDEDIKIGDLAPDGGQFRPHIVWFGESVPLFGYAMKVAMNSDVFVVIGTSLQVYPAASLIQYVPPFCPKYLINKEELELEFDYKNLTIIKKPATIGMKELKEILMKKAQDEL